MNDRIMLPFSIKLTLFFYGISILSANSFYSYLIPSFLFSATNTFLLLLLASLSLTYHGYQKYKCLPLHVVFTVFLVSLLMLIFKLILHPNSSLFSNFAFFVQPIILYFSALSFSPFFAVRGHSLSILKIFLCAFLLIFAFQLVVSGFSPESLIALNQNRIRFAFGFLHPGKVSFYLLSLFLVLSNARIQFTLSSSFKRFILQLLAISLFTSILLTSTKLSILLVLLLVFRKTLPRLSGSNSLIVLFGCVLLFIPVLLDLKDNESFLFLTTGRLGIVSDSLDVFLSQDFPSVLFGSNPSILEYTRYASVEGQMTYVDSRVDSGLIEYAIRFGLISFLCWIIVFVLQFSNSSYRLRSLPVLALFSILIYSISEVGFLSTSSLFSFIFLSISFTSYFSRRA